MISPDITNCEKEPIHIPGKIQSHGFLIAIDKRFIIKYCSENIPAFIAVAPKSLLGKNVTELDVFLQRTDTPGFISTLIILAKSNRGYEFSNPYLLKIADKFFNLVISVSNDFYLLEFEEDDMEVTTFNIGNTLSKILGEKSLPALLNSAVSQVKKVIGYDRVMIYKFHDDGHGEVVAEEKNEGLKSLYGLHYPASDIPKQARDLYKINLTRLIADADAEPSSIVTMDEGNPVPLDLTHSGLRAVSPVHIQYLKNMGVASSFSISLIHNNELWGLIACHNYTKRFINFKNRETSKLIGQVLSSNLSFRQTEEDESVSNHFKAAVASITNQLLRYNDIQDALFNYDVTLLNVVDATGAVLFFDNQVFCCGVTPDQDKLLSLIYWLNDHMKDDLFHTNNLTSIYPQALAYTKIASGIMVCRLSKELQEYIIWFRPELIKNLKWAGNPNKPVEYDADKGVNFLTPRKSFEAWSETVQQTAVSWKMEDIKSAISLKEEVSFAIRRKASHIRVLNDKLKVAYDELDAFSYTISHDLKNPLTAIKSYSQLLSISGDLQPEVQKIVDRILLNSNKMQSMIETILNYSRFGQAQLSVTLVDMNSLLNEIKNELLVPYKEKNVQVIIENTPEIFADNTMIMQVFSNLIGNAIKYSEKITDPVIIINGEDQGNNILYTVTDNGIGIRPLDQERIFDLFTRSEEVSDYDGTGVGLSIVKKIMYKHQGKIWLKSEINKGTVFYLSFTKTILSD